MCPKATLKCICENASLHIAAQAVNWICVSGKGLRHIPVNIFVVYKRATAFSKSHVIRVVRRRCMPSSCSSDDDALASAKPAKRARQAFHWGWDRASPLIHIWCFTWVWPSHQGSKKQKTSKFHGKLSTWERFFQSWSWDFVRWIFFARNHNLRIAHPVHNRCVLLDRPEPQKFSLCMFIYKYILCMDTILVWISLILILKSKYVNRSVVYVYILLALLDLSLWNMYIYKYLKIFR